MKLINPDVQAVVIYNKVFVPCTCNYFKDKLNGFASVDLGYFICLSANKEKEKLLKKLKLKPYRLYNIKRRKGFHNFHLYEPKWDFVQPPIGPVKKKLWRMLDMLNEIREIIG